MNNLTINGSCKMIYINSLAQINTREPNTTHMLQDITFGTGAYASGNNYAAVGDSDGITNTAIKQ